jgi:hypothetical protein
VQFLLFWVICYVAFDLHFVSIFSCRSVFCPKLGLHLIPLQSLYLFYDLYKRTTLLFFSYISSHNFVHISPLRYEYYIRRPSHASWSDHRNNRRVVRVLQITKPLTVRFLLLPHRYICGHTVLFMPDNLSISILELWSFSAEPSSLQTHMQMFGRPMPMFYKILESRLIFLSRHYFIIM